jgi:hypothetical protein
MATATHTPVAKPVRELEIPGVRTTPIPPLRNGDHLSRAEFERRYCAMPDGTKAELIDGVRTSKSAGVAGRGLSVER